MDKAERIIHLVVDICFAALMLLICVKLAGCALAAKIDERVRTRERIVEAVKTAYAEGGQVAVSNRIERLVGDGTLSRRQADRIHAAAQSVYEKVLEKLEAEIAADGD